MATASDACAAHSDRATEILLACARAAESFEMGVTGGCMEPALREGSRVVLGRRDVRPPRMGDVVLTHVDGRFRLHRLVWRPLWSRRWRTMADRSRALDPVVAPESVLGVVVECDQGNSCRRRWLAVRSLLRATRRRLRGSRA